MYSFTKSRFENEIALNLLINFNLLNFKNLLIRYTAMFESVHNYYVIIWVLVLFFNNLCPYHLLFCLQYCFRMFEMQAILCVLTYNLWKKNWTILMCILTFDSHTCINLTIIFKKKIRLKNGNAQVQHALFSIRTFNFR